MGDRWGESGPPDEAYSRVTRDLAVVTAEYGRYLDDLPGRLEWCYRCRTRALEEPERRRLDGVRSLLSREGSSSYAVAPEGPDRATLLVVRSAFEGGAAALFALGVVSSELVPDCFCDACDPDSESLIEQAEGFIQVAIGGCVEFRREHRMGRLPSWAAPVEHHWMEEGYRTAHSGAAHADEGIKGEPFEREWLPWLSRA
jgi:hypothetical protein